MRFSMQYSSNTYGTTNGVFKYEIAIEKSPDGESVRVHFDFADHDYREPRFLSLTLPTATALSLAEALRAAPPSFKSATLLVSIDEAAD